MKNLYLLLALLSLHSLTYSQMRMAIIGGPNSSNVKETNSLTGWETSVKPN